MTQGRPARWRLRLRLTPDDVGQRVVVRWRRPTVGGPDEVADILGELAAMDEAALRVIDKQGLTVVVPLERALAGKVVPPPPVRHARGRG